MTSVSLTFWLFEMNKFSVWMKEEESCWTSLPCKVFPVIVPRSYRLFRPVRTLNASLVLLADAFCFPTGILIVICINRHIINNKICTSISNYILRNNHTVHSLEKYEYTRYLLTLFEKKNINRKITIPKVLYYKITRR